MLAAGFFFLTGCSRQQDNNENQLPGGDIDNELDNDISNEADTDIQNDLDHDTNVSVDADVDSYVDLDAADADFTEYTDADADEIPETPLAPGISKFTEAPCAFPASLSYDSNSDRMLTTCGGQPNAIFRSTPLSDESNVEWEEAGYADGFPSNHITISEDINLITHSNPHGFTIVDKSIGAKVDGVDFATLPLVDDLGFAPNNPSGAAFVGGWIYVATSNIDVADYNDPTKTTYHPGTVIACPYDLTNGVDENACVAHNTSVENPTGVMLLNDDELAVLSSNTYDLSENGNASLTVFDLETMNGTAYSLGNITAQISPKLAMTSSGLILVGVQKPANALISINPEDGTIMENRELPIIANFISAIEAYGDTAIISDFGIFGEKGQVVFTDTRANGWEGIPTTELSGSAGPSVMIDDKLYQVVTAQDGMSASIWTIDVGAMQ